MGFTLSWASTEKNKQTNMPVNGWCFLLNRAAVDLVGNELLEFSSLKFSKFIEKSPTCSLSSRSDYDRINQEKKAITMGGFSCDKCEMLPLTKAFFYIKPPLAVKKLVWPLFECHRWNTLWNGCFSDRYIKCCISHAYLKHSIWPARLHSSVRVGLLREALWKSLCMWGKKMQLYFFLL